MKKKQRQILNEHLPEVLPLIQKLLEERGLSQFFVSKIVVQHEDDKPLCPPGKEPCRVLSGSVFKWICVPDGDCPNKK